MERFITILPILAILIAISAFAAQYARLNEQGGQLYDRTDGHAVAIDGRMVFWPDADTLESAGYYAVPPVTNAVLRWSLVDGRLVPEYAPPPPPVPVEYSKHDIIEELYAADLYDRFADFIDSLPRVQRDLWQNSLVIASDDPVFSQVLLAIPAVLGITQDEVDEILSRCIAH